MFWYSHDYGCVWYIGPVCDLLHHHNHSELFRVNNKPGNLCLTFFFLHGVLDFFSFRFLQAVLELLKIIDNIFFFYISRELICWLFFPVTLTWTDGYFEGGKRHTDLTMPIIPDMSPPLWAEMPHAAPWPSRRRRHPFWSHGMQQEGAGWQNDEAQTNLTSKIPQQRKRKYIKCVQMLFWCNTTSRWIQDKATSLIISGKCSDFFSPEVAFVFSMLH